MKTVLLIFLGSGLGGVARHYLNNAISSQTQSHFPFGILAVNILACLLIGLLVGLAAFKSSISPQHQLFLVVGFCGGFSTFSTFTSETIALWNSGHAASAITYILASLVLCLAANGLGLLAASKLS